MSVRILVAALAVAVSFSMSAPNTFASHLSDKSAPCTCSVSLGFARPQLQFVNGVLTFIPRVNISIRSRGSSQQPPWTVLLEYSGTSSYTSDDVTVPAGIAVNGSPEPFHGNCGSRYSFNGFQLSSVPLPGLTPSLVEADQQLNGTIQLKAKLTGCQEEVEEKKFSFVLKEFGNLVIRGWRTVR